MDTIVLIITFLTGFWLGVLVMCILFYARGN
jgi:hypothetical protein